VTALAKEHGVSGSQIALAWILSKPYITSPIIGATKLDHLDQAIAALDIRLSEEEIQQLEDAYKPHPILGHS
jgi:aryl-alcohol dehydrogenase (NADP+)